jgi:hypothetical protein
MVRDHFSNDIFQQLQSPYLTISFKSPASQMMYHFPFLFDFERRVHLFRMTGFDLLYSLPYMNRIFAKGVWDGRLMNLTVKCQLSRDRFWDDAMKLLKFIGPGSLRLEIAFTGEEGIGQGPTQEFFTLLGHEFCRTSRNLWRNANYEGGSDFAWSEGGLFPRPDAPPERFYWLGVACGKAVLMDVILSVPFNPAFLKMVIGGTVTVAEVDPQLARSLAQPAGLVGQPFTYPGIPELELVRNGANVEVTEANLAEFVRLIERTTVELPEIVTQFRAGLSTIVPWELFRMFTPDEMRCVISGETPAMTREDLERYAVISHGFSADSPQVTMFYELIGELSPREQSFLVRFITGSDRLPIGGLRNLSPPLTLAVRAVLPGQSPDETLPSVMTCTNYFKVPEYSSREMMKQQVLKAILEGQESFWLT